MFSYIRFFMGVTQVLKQTAVVTWKSSSRESEYILQPVGNISYFYNIVSELGKHVLESFIALPLHVGFAALYLAVISELCKSDGITNNWIKFDIPMQISTAYYY